MHVHIRTHVLHLYVSMTAYCGRKYCLCTFVYFVGTLCSRHIPVVRVRELSVAVILPLLHSLILHIYPPPPPPPPPLSLSLSLQKQWNKRWNDNKLNISSVGTDEYCGRKLMYVCAIKGMCFNFLLEYLSDPPNGYNTVWAAEHSCHYHKS